jgi:thiol-disulfide isomerase/thioredoxin
METRNVLFLRLRILSISFMNRFSTLLVIIFTLLVSISAGKAQEEGYAIKVKITGLENQTIILGHYFGTTMLPADTLKADENGYGVFTKDETLLQGLYILYFEDGSYFEIMMGEDQTFYLETDTSNYVKNLKIEGSPDNEIFIDFQNYMLKKRDVMMELQNQLKATENEKEKEKLTTEIQDLGQERVRKIHEIAEKYPTLFVSTFLKATLEVDVPEELKDDPKARYQYYKDHYFDNFDVSDVRLLQTPLYENKILYYLDKVVVQVPDSLIKEIDWLISRSEADSSLFRYMLITLFNKYGKSEFMGMDAVQVHIADNYYIEKSWWSDEKFIADLKERVEILKPLLIGAVAPNVQLRYVPAEHFKNAESDTALKRFPHAGSFFNIADIDAEFTVLIFWESTCSHCKKVVPDLYQIYQDTLKAQQVKIVAISTLFGEDGKEKWVDFINNKKLYDWINAWNPYDYKYKEIYDIRSTPQIYVLDKNKEIIGKRLGPENVPDLISAYKKMNKTE